MQPEQPAQPPRRAQRTSHTMGIPITGGAQQAPNVKTGSFTAAGNGEFFRPDAGCPFNFNVGGSGWTATIVLQRSFDAGANWTNVSVDGSGTASAYTAPLSLQITEWEDGMQYRVATSAYTSGTIPWRLSQ